MAPGTGVSICPQWHCRAQNTAKTGEGSSSTYTATCWRDGITAERSKQAAAGRSIALPCAAILTSQIKHESVQQEMAPAAWAPAPRLWSRLPAPFRSGGRAEQSNGTARAGHNAAVKPAAVSQRMATGSVRKAPEQARALTLATATGLIIFTPSMTSGLTAFIPGCTFPFSLSKMVLDKGEELMLVPVMSLVWYRHVSCHMSAGRVCVCACARLLFVAERRRTAGGPHARARAKAGRRTSSLCGVNLVMYEELSMYDRNFELSS